MLKKTKDEAAQKLQLFNSLMLSKEKIQKIKGGASGDKLPKSGRLDTMIIEVDVIGI
jgi:hypothetical protein